MAFLETIKEKSGAQFRPGGAADIANLHALGVPEDGLAFYRATEPIRVVEIAKVRLLPISHVLTENRDYVPGCYIQPHGFVVFATTLYGDAFCFDINSASSNATASVVLMAHDLDWDWDAAKREDLAKVAKPAAASLENFLEAFAAESLDIRPLYPGEEQ